VKICVAYTVVSNGPISDQYASRFVATWHESPPGVETDLLIICNGGPVRTELAMIFAPLNAKMFPRENDAGQDISGYQDASRGPCAEYDAVLWCGESVHFHKEGWLKRLVEAYGKHGPGMYGPFSSNAVRAHLNTTAFFCPPLLVRQYPIRPTDRASRMAFEHGENALWRRVYSRGMPVRLVTWDGEWEPRLWRMPKNILWRGDQSNCLMFCNHSSGYENADARTKQEWQRRTDAPFK
jgi:hypothetical protein